MTSLFARLAGSAAVAVVVTLAAPALAAPFLDPLVVPSAMSPLAEKSLLLGVARAGDRFVAVGQRGHILVSTDSGATWKQAAVPVSSDLTAVYFVNDRKGWAVGHDGVVLATTDGGESWALQFDGLRANERLVEYMQRRVAEQPASEEMKRLLGEAQRNQELGADKPFLDVWFADENTGFIVGAYNLIFHTTDGGKNWQPWFDRTDNPKLFNLYAIRPAAGGLFVAGEGGLALKLDHATQRFRALELPYKGSFFGVIGGADGVLVYGLRGNAFHSDDGGKTWTKLDVGLRATIVGGIRNSAGLVALVDAGGRIAASSDGGKTFERVQATPTVPMTGAAEIGNHRYVVVGPRGVTVVARKGS